MSNEPRVNNAEDTGGRQGNPWIQHYRYANRQAARNSSLSHIKASSTTTVNQFPERHFQIRHQDSMDSNTGSSHFYFGNLFGTVCDCSNFIHELRHVSIEQEMYFSSS